MEHAVKLKMMLGTVCLDSMIDPNHTDTHSVHSPAHSLMQPPPRVFLCIVHYIN